MSSSIVPVLASFLSVAFLGSWHCGAMCGPIAAAIGRERSLVYYHLGRWLTYTSVGAIAGLLGREVASLSNFSLKMSGFILLSLLLFISVSGRTVLPSPIKACPQLAIHRSGWSQFLFGMCSILMPCGWLWSFVAASAATSSPWAGALVMTGLWLSSVPALSLAGAYFRSTIKKLPPRRQIWVSRILVVCGFYSLTVQFFFHH